MKSRSRVMQLFGMVRLSCEYLKRYLRLLQSNGGEEIGCAQILPIDARSFDRTGALMLAAPFDIKILHQGDAREEGLAGHQPEGLGNPAERFQPRVRAFQ